MRCSHRFNDDAAAFVLLRSLVHVFRVRSTAVRPVRSLAVKLFIQMSSSTQTNQPFLPELRSRCLVQVFRPRTVNFRHFVHTGPVVHVISLTVTRIFVRIAIRQGTASDIAGRPNGSIQNNRDLYHKVKPCKTSHSYNCTQEPFVK